MPDHYELKKKPFSELSKKAQLEKVQGIIDKTDRVLKGPTRSNSRPVRARAEEAQRAASRVKSRITGKLAGGSKKTSSSTGSTAKGVRGILSIARSIVGLPGRFKEGFEEVIRKSKGE